MENILYVLRTFLGDLFRIWHLRTFAGLLIFCGAYLTVKLIKGMLVR